MVMMLLLDPPTVNTEQSHDRWKAAHVSVYLLPVIQYNLLSHRAALCSDFYTYRQAELQNPTPAPNNAPSQRVMQLFTTLTALKHISFHGFIVCWKSLLFQVSALHPSTKKYPLELYTYQMCGIEKKISLKK